MLVTLSPGLHQRVHAGGLLTLSTASQKTEGGTALSRRMCFPKNENPSGRQQNIFQIIAAAKKPYDIQQAHTSMPMGES